MSPRAAEIQNSLDIDEARGKPDHRLRTKEFRGEAQREAQWNLDRREMIYIVMIRIQRRSETCGIKDHGPRLACEIQSTIRSARTAVEGLSYRRRSAERHEQGQCQQTVSCLHIPLRSIHGFGRFSTLTSDPTAYPPGAAALKTETGA